MAEADRAWTHSGLTGEQFADELGINAGTLLWFERNGFGLLYKPLHQPLFELRAARGLGGGAHRRHVASAAPANTRASAPPLDCAKLHSVAAACFAWRLSDLPSDDGGTTRNKRPATVAASHADHRSVAKPNG